MIGSDDGLYRVERVAQDHCSYYAEEELDKGTSIDDAHVKL